MSIKLSINKIKGFGLSGNILKIIAAISMLIDHIGVIFYPNVVIYRIIGRIAYPIFAFMIAEGCYYTRNKIKYFLSVFLLGAACQVVYYILNHELEMGILITFSLSILVVYSLQFTKEMVFAKCKFFIKALSMICFICVLLSVYFINKFIKIDYGFFGCIAPAFAIILRKPKEDSMTVWRYVDNIFVRVLIFGVVLIILAITIGEIQIYSLFALPLLLLYSGKRGKLKMKYFFYIFYPVHLSILQAINYII